MRASGELDDGAESAGERTVGLRIFLNYRREDASGHAGHLFDELARLARYDIFMDIEKIEPGLPFKEAIDRALTSCDVFLALIGRTWLDARDSSGRRRLDNPNDFVRLEIASALARESVRVIPVLVQKAEMPRSEELPEPLHRLTERHALELSDTRWQYDVEQLVRVLDTIAAKKAGLENVHRQADERTRGGREGAGAAEPDAQAQESMRRPHARWWRSRAGIAVGLGVGVLVVAIVAVAVAGGGGDPPGTPTNGASPTTGSSTAPASPTDQYLADANSICAAHRSEIVNAFSAFQANPDGVIPPLQSLQLELQGLGPPPALPGAGHTLGANTYMDDLDRWIGTLQERDYQGAQVWQSAMDTHSREAGLQDCPPN